MLNEHKRHELSRTRNKVEKRIIVRAHDRNKKTKIHVKNNSVQQKETKFKIVSLATNTQTNKQPKKKQMILKQK